MLGGYCLTSGESHRKTYRNLPTHNILRIVAVYHFLDNWKGESGFLKINTGAYGEYEYIWAEKYDLSEFPDAYNVCGSDAGEAKFSSFIDITIPHFDDDIALEFGSTLEGDPCEKSYGVSSISLYVK